MKTVRKMPNAVAVVVVLMLMVLALGACTMGGGAEATVEEGGEVPVVPVTFDGSSVSVPAETPSGVVAFDTSGAPDAFVARLNDDVTLEQFTEALSQPDPTAAVAMVTLLGGASNTADGHVTLDLEPGAHVVVNFGELPVVAPFTAGEDSGATLPEADVVVDMVDFNFAVPSEVKTGPQVWQINNKGEQWHELVIVKLNEGVTVDDLMTMMASEESMEGPPPFEDVAFWSPNSPGQTGYVTWDFPPGEYTVLCFVPDLAGDFAPHAAHGMVAQLMVTE